NLRPDESPHEWLSWQQFMGNIERIERYHPDFAPFTPGDLNVDWLAEPVVPLRGNRPTAGDAWTLLAELPGDPGTVAANRLSAGPVNRFYPFMSDPQAQLYQVTANGAWNDWNLPLPLPYQAELTPRRYLIVENYRATHLVCLPVPWTSLAT